ncbi:MAG: phenylalanine--tRNA ligase subunit beta [Candidatus Aenigmarchaeota archaeon]|nr:phenylalanine--tRNA ligase subunit beta [Candidatus Aenigmarchaeota archaeon]
MPTIEISMKDLQMLIGKKISMKDLEKYLEYVKGEIENVEGDRVKIEIADTNRPDLWSTEGIAREIRTEVSSERGVPDYKIKKSGIKVIVDRNLKNIRPITVCAVVRNLNIDEETLMQMIQLQEKVCETFGRKRKEVALGIYDMHKIKSPITFKAFPPEEIKFVPLDFEKELDLRQILLQHPKGQEYGHLLEGMDKYPVFIDAGKNVLSLPPIINSNYTGKVTSETRDVFIECSGFDMKFQMPALDIMVAAMADRGGTIESVDVVFPDKTIVTPVMERGRIKVDLDYIKKRSGLDMKKEEIKNLLSRARFNANISGNNVDVEYPSYRQDIMHPSDVVEDIIIRYGYNNIKPAIPKIPTTGSQTETSVFSSVIRNLMIGTGAQEILSYYLTNKENLIERMNLEDMNVVEVENPVSDNWCIFRTWLIPSLIEFFSRNKKKEYPQRIFEVGEVVIPDSQRETMSSNPTRLAWGLAGKDAGFTQAKQNLDFLMDYLGIRYEIKEKDHPSFIPGRTGRVYVNGKGIAYIGEVHPQVLENWGIEVPVTCFEINLTDLFSVMKK